MFKFNPNNLITAEILGKTSISSVHPYQKEKSSNKWAVKQITTKNFDLFCEVMHEVILNYNCDHPSIVPVRGYHIEVLKPRGCNVYLKMPRMQGNLSDLIAKYSNNNTLSTEKVVKVLYDLVCGLQYLHSKRIAHTNIKPSNILTDKDGEVVKLSDAGPAKSALDEDDSKSKEETSCYKVPELAADQENLKRNDYYQADVWALGVVIAEFALLKNNLVSATAPEKDKEQAVKKLIGDIEKKYNKNLANIIEGMLNIDPKQRKTCSNVKSFIEETFKEIVNVGKSKEQSVSIEKPEKPQSKEQPLKHWNLIKKDVREVPENSFKFQQKKKSNVSSPDIKSSENPTTGGFEEFMETINEKTKEFKITGVQGMDLDMSEANHITDKEIKTLVSNVSQNCQGLQQLCLNLNDCHQITDSGVQELAMSIDQNLKDLQNLTLKFGSKSWENNSFGNITNKGVEHFFNNVSGNLKNLQQLSLSFSKCIDINDDGLKCLGTNISQNMNDLQNLHLEFESCDRITNKGLKHLADSFAQGPKNLQQLNLCFIWCTNISDEGVKQLCASIAENCKSLQKLTLSFPTCLFVTKKLKKSLRETLDLIPFVKVD